MKKLLVLLALFALVFGLKAQYPPDTVYYQCPEPAIAMPQLGQSIVDSACSIRITRITDYNPQWDWYPVHDYAKIQPWNADETMYKFYSVAVFDARTFTLIRELPDIYYSLWSNTNPDLIYSFRQDGAILKYFVTADSIDTLMQIEGYQKILLGPGEGNIDTNDRFVALVAKNAQDMTVLTVDLQAAQIVSSKTFPGAWGDSEKPQYIDWVSVSQSGNFTVIMWNTNLTSADNPFDGHYGVEVFSTQNLNFLRRLIDYGNHGDLGVTDSGDEVFVQFYGQGGTIHSYRLTDGQHTVLHENPDFGYGDAHLSCRNIRRPGWAYLSTDPEKGGLILAIKLDGSQTVEMWGHHFSSSDNYVKCPMPVPSPSGKQVMFRSDFGNADNPDLVYEFIAQYDQPTHSEQSQQFSVYPNPTNGPVFLNVTLPAYQLEIFSLNGRPVFDQKITGRNPVRLDLGQLPNGIYIIRVSNGKFSLWRKIVKLSAESDVRN